MTVRKKTAIHGPPLTTAEVSGIPKPGIPYRVITCIKCSKGGGTLVRQNDHYLHYSCQDNYEHIRKL